MIYQCYFKREQEARAFSHEGYRMFGLEPELNASLLDKCPELADADTRLALCEYAAFLNCWRHLDGDSDDWIGFTSYRQLDKSGVVFESKAAVEQELSAVDMLAWHGCFVGHVRSRRLWGAAAQAELGHGMHQFTLDMLRLFDFKLPDEYETATVAPFANYWILRKSRFAEFMHWSWPIVQVALTVNHPYKSFPSRGYWDDQRKRVGYFAERLFIIWSMREALTTTWLGIISPMEYRRPKRSWREIALWWRYANVY